MRTTTSGRRSKRFFLALAGLATALVVAFVLFRVFDGCAAPSDHVPTAPAAAASAETAADVDSAAAPTSSPSSRRTSPPPIALGVERSAFKETAAPTIRGVVVSEEGEPLAATLVVVRSGESFAAATGSFATSEDGVFEIPVDDAGPYDLDVRAASFEPETLRFAAAPVDVGRVRLAPSGFVSGVVVDESDSPIADASVVIRSHRDGAGPGTTYLCDDQGRFGPAPIEWIGDLHAVAPGRVPETVVVRRQTEFVRVRLASFRPLVVKARSIDDRRPLRSFAVEVWRYRLSTTNDAGRAFAQSERFARTTTDDAGVARVEVPAEAATGASRSHLEHDAVFVAGEGYAPRWIDLREASGEELVVDLAPAARVVGRVVDAAGKPAPGVRVRASNAALPTAVTRLGPKASFHPPPNAAGPAEEDAARLRPPVEELGVVVTDEAGAYEVAVPCPSSAPRVRLSAEGRAVVECDVDARRVVRAPDLVLDGVPRSVRGVVRASDGAPVRAARVAFLGRRTTTDADGRFDLAIGPTTPSRESWLSVHAFGYVRSSTFIEIDKADFETTVILKEAHRLMGRMVAADGGAPEKTSVFAVPASLSEALASETDDTGTLVRAYSTGKTTTSGRFEIDVSELPARLATSRLVGANRRRNQLHPIVAKADEPIVLVVGEGVLSGAGIASDTTPSVKGTGVADVRCVLMVVDGSVDFATRRAALKIVRRGSTATSWARTDAAGEAVFKGVGAGSYEVFVGVSDGPLRRGPECDLRLVGARPTTFEVADDAGEVRVETPIREGVVTTFRFRRPPVDPETGVAWETYRIAGWSTACAVRVVDESTGEAKELKGGGAGRKEAAVVAILFAGRSYSYVASRFGEVVARGTCAAGDVVKID
jgi:hypothetical protein